MDENIVQHDALEALGAVALVLMMVAALAFGGTIDRETDAARVERAAEAVEVVAWESR